MRMTALHRALLLIGIGVIAVAALWWKCRFDPAMNFLPTDGRCDWIVFPTPVSAGAHRIAMMDTIFRQTFSLESKPPRARMLVRAAKRLELKINGAAVQVSTSPNWKEPSIVDVQNFLRSGENKIEARVFNDDAPPALWLHLDADPSTVRTNGSWEASFAGSAWRRVAIATEPKHPGPGNLLAGGETTFAVLPKVWSTWAVFAGIGVMVALFGDRWFNNPTAQTILITGVAALAWALLCWNNTRLLPFHCGYDSPDHVSYIRYIQERKALPLPTEGFEGFQAPLYYGLSAAALSMARLTVADSGSIGLLRALTMSFGFAHFIVVLLCLRLLFPGRSSPQIIGSLLAAFLPMQLYLSHYVTNETLAAALVGLAMYFALRVLKTDTASIWEFVGLGLSVGAAMLTKATAVLVVPPLLGALILKMARDKVRLRAATSRIATTLVTAFAVCGWYYGWIWEHFGTPIVGNWERRFGFNWWQDPGFHTATQYFRLGGSLFDPLFSGYNSFVDGIYSTLWGDGLGGGLSDMLSRTPWNYDLMVGGYWLALIPTLLAVIGIAIAIYRFVQQPSPEWFLLIGFSAAVVVALVFMTLRVASYAQVKAFYGLSALVPLCAFAAIGWEKIQQRSKWVRLTFTSIFVVWALNSFFAFWIRDSASQHIYAGRLLARDGHLDAATNEGAQAVRLEPSNSMAQCFLASILDQGGQTNETMEHTLRGLQIDPTNGFCRLQQAVNIGNKGDISQGLDLARHLIEAEPENALAYNVEFTCARQLNRADDAVAVARNGLAVSPFNDDFHYNLGLAAAEVGDFSTAVPHFAYALLLQPSRREIEQKMRMAVAFAAKAPNAADQIAAIAAAAPQFPPLLNELGWVLATSSNPAVRNGAEAVRFSQQACDLTNRARPRFLVTLAAAYGEIGRFADGATAADQAVTIARVSGDSSTSALAETVLNSLKNRQPYREESTP